MNDIKMKLVATLAMVGLGLALIAGCNQDLGLEGKTFSCNEPSDCADGFECDMDRQVCVAEGSAGTQDATDDTTEDTSDVQDTTDTADAEDTTDTGEDADASPVCDCDDGQVCNDDDICVECIDRTSCASGQICVENQCQANVSCTARDQCPDGFACDFVEGECVAEENWCRTNTDCDDSTARVCSVQGICVDWDAECETPRDCAPGSQCSKGQCRPPCDNASDCQEVCGDSCTCNTADGFCFGESTPRCEGAKCNEALICLQDSGLCGTCDSRSDCTDGQYCTERNECLNIPAGSCTNQSGCGEKEICTGDSLAPGTCVLWRCEYGGITAGCRDYAYCDKADVGGVAQNICLASTCGSDSNTGCGSGLHCVERTEGKGVCARTGTASTFDGCTPNVNNPDENCKSRHACLPTGSGTHKCQLICNPWADPSCAADSGTCVPTPGVLGTCQDKVNLNAVDCNSAELLTPCAARSVCLPGPSGRECLEVCRLDRPSDCELSSVCNPALVPGDIGWGRCVEPCSADVDCNPNNQTNRVCRTSRFSSLGYCAKRCGSNADCPGADMICKDGFCD